MRATASRTLPLHRGKPCPARLIALSRPGSSPAFVTDPIALMGNGMGRNSTRGHPSPWAVRAPAEAELPHIDPRRGVLSTELGLTPRLAHRMNGCARIHRAGAERDCAFGVTVRPSRNLS